MLIIRFYDLCQKYVDKTEPFQNHEISAKLHAAFDKITQHPEIAGCVIYESIGNEWMPYNPFNRHCRYERNSIKTG